MLLRLVAHRPRRTATDIIETFQTPAHGSLAHGNPCLFGEIGRQERSGPGGSRHAAGGRASFHRLGQPLLPGERPEAGVPALSAAATQGGAPARLIECERLAHGPGRAADNTSDLDLGIEVAGEEHNVAPLADEPVGAMPIIVFECYPFLGRKNGHTDDSHGDEYPFQGGEPSLP